MVRVSIWGISYSSTDIYLNGRDYEKRESSFPRYKYETATTILRLRIKKTANATKTAAFAGKCYKNM
jgi:hypothetical protein